MLRKWLKRDPVPQVSQKDLEKIVIAYGLSEQLFCGDLRCSECGNPVSLQNIECIYKQDDEIKVCCDDYNCCKAVFDKKITDTYVHSHKTYAN